MNLCLGYECPSVDLNNDQTDSFDTSANIILITNNAIKNTKAAPFQELPSQCFQPVTGPDDLSIS